jgi:hypothetical protein
MSGECDVWWEHTCSSTSREGEAKWACTQQRTCVARMMVVVESGCGGCGGCDCDSDDKL